MYLKSLIESTDQMLAEGMSDNELDALHQLFDREPLNLAAIDKALLSMRISEEDLENFVDDFLDENDIDGLDFTTDGVINLNNDDQRGALLYNIEGYMESYDLDDDLGMFDRRMDDRGRPEVSRIADECETLRDCLNAMMSYTSHSEMKGADVEINHKGQLIIRMTEEPFRRGDPSRVEHRYFITRLNGRPMHSIELDYVKNQV